MMCLERLYRYDYNSHVNHPGIAELKAHLSSYLDQVKGGHEVLITDRGVPIAKLVPLEPGQKQGGRRERLARAGILQLGRGRARKALAQPPSGEPLGGGVLAALLAEREEQR